MKPILLSRVFCFCLLVATVFIVGQPTAFGQTGSAGSSLLALLGEKAETSLPFVGPSLRLETGPRVATLPATSFPRPAPAVATVPAPPAVLSRVTTPSLPAPVAPVASSSAGTVVSAGTVFSGPVILSGPMLGGIQPAGQPTFPWSTPSFPWTAPSLP